MAEANSVNFDEWVHEKNIELDSMHNQTMQASRIDSSESYSVNDSKRQSRFFGGNAGRSYF